jgi:hypothetical protein
MTTTNIDNSQRTAARIAGWSYLVSFAVVVFANYVLLGPLIIPRNAVDTARNILAYETQFRISLGLFLIYSVGAVVLAGALFIILKPINHYLALLGALFRLVFAMSWLLSAIHMLGALRFLGTTPYLQIFEPARLQVLSRVTMAATFDDYYVGLPFFGLAATVCAWLWLKSKYIPRGLATFGVIASAWCVFCAFVYLIFPNFNKIVNDYIFDTPMALFELVLSFWLLLKGLRPTAPIQSQAGTA